MPYPEIRLTQHAAERGIERGVTREEIVAALREGSVIEEYTTSYLLMASLDRGPLHIVARDFHEDSFSLVITLYDPRTQPKKWSDDFRRRQP